MIYFPVSLLNNTDKKVLCFAQKHQNAHHQNNLTNLRYLIKYLILLFQKYS
jgi:uncharacterized membrane protein